MRAFISVCGPPEFDYYYSRILLRIALECRRNAIEPIAVIDHHYSELAYKLDARRVASSCDILIAYGAKDTDDQRLFRRKPTVILVEKETRFLSACLASRIQEALQ